MIATKKTSFSFFQIVFCKKNFLGNSYFSWKFWTFKVAFSSISSPFLEMSNVLELVSIRPLEVMEWHHKKFTVRNVRVNLAEIEKISEKRQEKSSWHTAFSYGSEKRESGHFQIKLGNHFFKDLRGKNKHLSRTSRTVRRPAYYCCGHPTCWLDIELAEIEGEFGRKHEFTVDILPNQRKQIWISWPTNNTAGLKIVLWIYLY